MTEPSRFHGRTGALAIAAVLTLAAAVRIPGLFWGVNLESKIFYQPHADEVNLTMISAGIRRGDDRKKYPYPRAFPLVSTAVAAAAGIPAIPKYGTVRIGPVMCSRLVSLVFALLSVWLLFFGLRRAGVSPEVGLLAGLFLAVAPLHVMYSHIGTADVMAAFLGLLAVVLAVQALASSRYSSAVWCAVATAGALATKFNPFAFVPMAIAAWAVRRDGWLIWGKRVAGMAVVGYAAFFWWNGFLFDWEHLQGILGNAKWDNLRVKAHPGPVTVPFFLLLLFVGCAAPCALFGVIGLCRRLRNRSPEERAMLSVVLPTGIAFLLVIARLSIPYARHAMALVPLLCILAGLGLRDVLSRPFFQRRGAAAALVAAVVVYQLAAVASIEIYFVDEPVRRYWNYTAGHLPKDKKIYETRFWIPNFNTPEKALEADFVMMPELWFHLFERSQINPLGPPDCSSPLYRQGRVDCETYRMIAHGNRFRLRKVFTMKPFVPEQMVYTAVWGGYPVYLGSIRLYEKIQA